MQKPSAPHAQLPLAAQTFAAALQHVRFRQAQMPGQTGEVCGADHNAAPALAAVAAHAAVKHGVNGAHGWHLGVAGSLPLAWRSGPEKSGVMASSLLVLPKTYTMSPASKTVSGPGEARVTPSRSTAMTVTP